MKNECLVMIIYCDIQVQLIITMYIYEYIYKKVLTR